MRAWLLTNTTYGSWLPGDARGSVTSVRDFRPGEEPSLVRIEHDVPGEPWEEPLPGLFQSAKEKLKGPPIFFDLEKTEILLGQFQETASYRHWTLRAVAIMINHFHMVVQVLEDPDPKKMLADFKAYGSRILNQRYGKPPSETWWTEKGSKRKLADDAALANAGHYVLYKQPNPLVVWSSESGRII